MASGVNEDLLRDLVGYEYNIININAFGVDANRILMEFYIYIYIGSVKFIQIQCNPSSETRKSLRIIVLTCAP